MKYLSKPISVNLYVEEALPKHWIASVMPQTNKNKYGDGIFYYNIRLNKFYRYNPDTKELQCLEDTKGGSKSTRKQRKTGVKTSRVKV